MRGTDGRMRHLLFTGCHAALCQPLQLSRLNSACSMTFQLPTVWMDGDYFEVI